MTTSARTLRVGATTYPVVLPSLRDPRLHLAAVIITIHVLGQVALGFHVSIAQILVAIGTCAAIEVVWTARTARKLVWPASAMLTGSGVALIFRVLGTEHGDWWSLEGAHLFALVAGGSLLTKYLIRWRGTHVFNPSNVGLVVAFLLLGSSRVEPLDFWWAPLEAGMIAAYAVIIVGGLLITRRLRLLGMAAAFWLTLVAAIGVLAASGHCITARWSFVPVCDGSFWWLIATSPEVLIFLFFMITDPKTAPRGRVGRIAFGAAVALAATLFIAPQTTEFGAKVGLLAGLVVLCPLRLAFDRLAPEAGSVTDSVRALITRSGRSRLRLAGGLVGAVGIVGLLGLGVAAAGAPARGPARDVGSVGGTVSYDGPFSFDASALPTVTVDPEVEELDDHLAGPGAAELALRLAQNLEIEAAAVLAGDRDVLAALDFGARLEAMEAAALAMDRVVDTWTFEQLHLTVAYPFGEQGGASPALIAQATVERTELDESGRRLGTEVLHCRDIVFTFVPSADGEWLLLEVAGPDGTAEGTTQDLSVTCTS